MEKKRTNFFILAKLTFTAIFLTLIFSTHAQKLEIFKTYCGGFYKSMDDLRKMQQKELTFMISDQDKRLQVLAPNVPTGKRPMLLQQTA